MLATNRMLIIDDDPEFCNLISLLARGLQYETDQASNWESAQKKIQDSEIANLPFSIAIIDVRFKVGESSIKVARGKEILQYIKSHYPSIACVMVTGEGLAPDEVLDLRDEWNLDYYISKDRLDFEKFAEGISRALARNTSKQKPARKSRQEKKPTSSKKDLDGLENPIMRITNYYSVGRDIVQGDAINNSGLDATEATNLFEGIYATIRERRDTSVADRREIVRIVDELQAVVQKDRKEISSSFLETRLQNLKRMAPDICDVVIATLANPSVGVTTIVSKIAEKVRSDSETPN